MPRISTFYGIVIAMYYRGTVCRTSLASGVMEKIVHVTEVKVVGSHRLWLQFEDGAGGEIDFSGETWRGIFAPLADPAYFARVELDEELGTIVWPNGADFAPETLHLWVREGPGSVAAI